jgi:hypothetical protein
LRYRFSKKKIDSLFFGVAATGSSGFFSWFVHILLTFVNDETDDGGFIPLGLGMCDDVMLSDSCLLSLVSLIFFTIILIYNNINGLQQALDAHSIKTILHCGLFLCFADSVKTQRNIY